MPRAERGLRACLRGRASWMPRRGLRLNASVIRTWKIDRPVICKRQGAGSGKLRRLVLVVLVAELIQRRSACLACVCMRGLPRIFVCRHHPRDFEIAHGHLNALHDRLVGKLSPGLENTATSTPRKLLQMRRHKRQTPVTSPKKCPYATGFATKFELVGNA